jgi:hypothetical protein
MSACMTFRLRVRWSDWGVLMGLAGFGFAVVFAIALSVGAGIKTFVLSLLLIASRELWARKSPALKGRQARRKREMGRG